MLDFPANDRVALLSVRPAVTRGHAATVPAPLRLFFASIVLLTLTACGASLANRGRTDQTVGRATYYSIMTEIPEVLAREGYAIYTRRETSRSLYLETSWQERAPFEDEAAMGIEYARTRFIVRAQLAGPRVYALRLRVENQVQGLPDEEWHERAGAWSTAPSTEMYDAYVSEISTEIKLRVDAGMRIYGGPGS